jgi:hypothetical protein
MLTVVPGDGSGHEGGKDVPPSLIDEIVREGARRMLAEGSLRHRAALHRVLGSNTRPPAGDHLW